MGHVCEILSRLSDITGKRQRSRFDLIVDAMAVILLIANTWTFGSTIAELDPSRHYKLEKIDLSGEHALSRDTLVSVMTTKERPWYQVWKPLPDFDPQAFTDDLAHLKRFYEAHGYYDARVVYDLTVSKDKVTPHVTVKRRPADQSQLRFT